MKTKISKLPHGILVQWERVESAANYHITLTDPDGWFMCKRTVERDECYLSFNNLNVRTGKTNSEYSLLIEAANRSGDIIDKAIVSGTPSSIYEVSGTVSIRQSPLWP